MRGHRLLIAAALAASGCFWDERTDEYVRQSPIHVAQSDNLVQANTAACTRVCSLGHRLLSSNPDLPQSLVFRAAGQPTPEIFHQGTNTIVVTQKLVEMCQTDGELTALLALELGKIAAERMALASLQANSPAIRKPIDPGPRQDVAGMAGVQDPFLLRETVAYEEDQRRHAAGKPADANSLARLYLHRAGFKETELDRIKPLVRSAAENSDLERQMTTGTKTSPFSPPGQ